MRAREGPEGGSFRALYGPALQSYLSDPSERSLRPAYELGREALSRQLSVLDLAVAHQEALLLTLGEASGSAETQHVTRAAGDFFLESLSAFEMVQRGLGETREAAWLERRRAEMVRQLSGFLADVSLALDASGSLEEMLRLVAEQTRELVGAECCVATVAAEGQPRSAQGASCSRAGTRWSALVRWLDLSATYRLIRLRGGSVRIDGEQLDQVPAFRTSAADTPLRGWLAASLTALDGGELGAIQLFNKQGGAFTGDDEATVVFLAQMASAALERAQLYQARNANA